MHGLAEPTDGPSIDGFDTISFVFDFWYFESGLRVILKTMFVPTPGDLYASGDKGAFDARHAAAHAAGDANINPIKTPRKPNFRAKPMHYPIAAKWQSANIPPAANTLYHLNINGLVKTVKHIISKNIAGIGQIQGKRGQLQGPSTGSIIGRSWAANLARLIVEIDHPWLDRSDPGT